MTRLIANTIMISARKRAKPENSNQASMPQRVPTETVRETEGNQLFTEQSKDAPLKGKQTQSNGRADVSPTKKGNATNKGARTHSPTKSGGLGGFSATLQVHDEDDREEERFQFQLNYDINLIKKKYLFPFNQSSDKSNTRLLCTLNPTHIGANQRLKDDPTASYLPQVDVNSTKNELLNKTEYLFPFSHFKLSDNEIKQLQNPLRVVKMEGKCANSVIDHLSRYL